MDDLIAVNRLSDRIVVATWFPIAGVFNQQPVRGCLGAAEPLD